MDLKSEFMRDFELTLLPDFTPDQINIIKNQLLVSLGQYDLVKKTREIIPYDNTNEIIIKNFVGCLLIAGKSPKTAKQYAYEVRRFADFKGKKLTEVTAMDLKEYMAYQLAVKKVAKTTANNTKNYLSAFFTWLQEEGYVEVNPCATIKSVKQEQKIKEIFSEVELDRMRSLDLNSRNRALIEVLLSTGARIEEICALNQSDIDFQNLTVLIRGGKGGKDRITYLSKVAAYHLKIYLSERKDSIPALFLNYPNREVKYQDRITEDGVRNILRDIGHSLGIEKCHPHKFRRTLATSLYKKGMDLHEIQQILGHTSISVTMEYIVADNTMVQHSYNKFMN